MNKIKEFVNTKEGRHIVCIIIASIIIYNFYPILGMIFPSKAGLYTSLLDLMIIDPLYVVVINLILSELNGFNWKEALLSSLLFIPTLIIFYGISLSGYLVIYIALAFIANAIGGFIKDKAIKQPKEDN